MNKRARRTQKEILGEALRDLRLEEGLTQAQLARKLGKLQPFVSKYEAGERRLDLLEVRQICRILDIPLVSFLRRLDRLLK